MESLLSNNVNRGRGVLFILFSAVGFGSYGVWSRLVGDSFGVFYQSWTRALFITVILFPILYFTKQIVPVRREDWKWMSIFLIAASLTQAPVFYAFNHMDIGSATLLFFTSTLITMYVFGIIFLGETVGAIKVVSFVLAIIGLYVTFSFSIITFSLLAAAMAIVNGVASGTELSSSKKLTGSYAPLYVTFLSWFAIFICNGTVSFLLRETQHIPSFNIAWAYLLTFAVASVLSSWLVFAGLQYVESSIGALVGLLEIIFSITFGILIFHEGLASGVLIGGSFIITAAALPHLYEFRKMQRWVVFSVDKKM